MIPNSAFQYARGTEIFDQTAALYGEDAAVAQWQAAIDAERNGKPLPTNVWSIFGEQLATDPLGAPLEAANRTLGNTFLSFLKSPWVLLTLGLVLFFALGGFSFLKRQLAKK